MNRVHLACHDGNVRDLPLSACASRAASPAPTRTARARGPEHARDERDVRDGLAVAPQPVQPALGADANLPRGGGVRAVRMTGQLVRRVRAHCGMRGVRGERPQGTESG